MKRVVRLIFLLLLPVIIATCSSGSGSGSGCEPWSGWTRVDTVCKPRFWCFGSGQKGRYAVEERSRQCSGGIQKVQRDRFLSCGC